MSQSLPKQVKFLVIGAGVHGLSTAYHLARIGGHILILDFKQGPWTA